LMLGLRPSLNRGGGVTCPSLSLFLFSSVSANIQIRPQEYEDDFLYISLPGLLRYCIQSKYWISHERISCYHANPIGPTEILVPKIF
jgi:hypothetical protein